MKQCPNCQSLYTDDTLQFCLQDGTPLRAAPGNAPSEVYGEQETVVANRPSSQNAVPPPTNPTGWNPNQYQNNAAAQAPPKSSATTAVFLTALVMLILFGAAGIGLWVYFRGVKPDENTNLLIAKKSPNPEAANTSSSAPAKTTPSATPQQAANTAATPTPVDKEEIKKDVEQRVESWVSATENRDLGNYMENYAPTVDYYNKKGASVAAVRADKEKAFAAYDAMRIDISNLTVTPDEKGDAATAIFDKEWVFEGEKYSAGKVQSQLKFRKINGQWLISSERDLKVYYTE